MSNENQEIVASETHLMQQEAYQGGQAMQRVQSKFVTAMAVQKPRRLPDIVRRVKEEAALAGESFFYGWGAVGSKDRIEGPSVKLALACVRNFGNCSVEMAPIQELPDSWIFTAVFVDYETGFTLTRQFRMSKLFIVYGKHDEFRKQDIRFQIGQSKAIRNVVLNAMPQGLIDEAMDEAKSGARGKLEKFIKDYDAKNGAGKGFVFALDKVMVALLKSRIKEENIVGRFGRANRAGLDVDDLLIMRANLAAIEAGEARAEELFPPDKAEELTDRLKAAKDGNGNGNGHTETTVPPTTVPPPAAPKAEKEQTLAAFARDAANQIAEIDTAVQFGQFIDSVDADLAKKDGQHTPGTLKSVACRGAAVKETASVAAFSEKQLAAAKKAVESFLLSFGEHQLRD